jgi:hypothetical protein
MLVYKVSPCCPKQPLHQERPLGGVTVYTRNSDNLTLQVMRWASEAMYQSFLLPILSVVEKGIGTVSNEGL